MWSKKIEAGFVCCSSWKEMIFPEKDYALLMWEKFHVQDGISEIAFCLMDPSKVWCISEWERSWIEQLLFYHFGYLLVLANRYVCVCLCFSSLFLCTFSTLLCMFTLVCVRVFVYVKGVSWLNNHARANASGPNLFNMLRSFSLSQACSHLYIKVNLHCCNAMLPYFLHFFATTWFKFNPICSVWLS
jgi:hypothetical protein